MPALPSARYVPAFPKLYAFDRAHLAPALSAALEAGTDEALRALVRQDGPGVFSLPFFTESAARDWFLELKRYEHWCAHHAVILVRPNSMNHHGVVLDDVGFEAMLDDLLYRAVAPLGRVLLPDHAGATLDHHHGFLVEYGPGLDTALDLHVDDSEVTMNLCLGNEFAGGELRFRGLRCGLHRTTPTREGETFTVAHAPGRAIFHAGAHRHEALPMVSGHRGNVILWCRSSRHRLRAENARRCPAWCGSHLVGVP